MKKSSWKIHAARLAAFAGAAAIAIGLRTGSGLTAVCENGSYTVFTAADEEIKFDRLPLLSVRGGYERADFRGGEEAAERMLVRARARVLGEEAAGGARIIYAYSPFCGATAKTSHGEVNLTIAVRCDEVAAGSPLLKGSY